jgi:hypothetical protein
MAVLTITINDDLLGRVRLRALEQGISVNALLRDYLVAYAGAGDAHERALSDLLALSESATSRRGMGAWTRDDLHADAPLTRRLAGSLPDGASLAEYRQYLERKYE